MKHYNLKMLAYKLKYRKTDVTVKIVLNYDHLHFHFVSEFTWVFA